jgi:hypothetical protein
MLLDLVEKLLGLLIIVAMLILFMFLALPSEPHTRISSESIMAFIGIGVSIFSIFILSYFRISKLKSFLHKILSLSQTDVIAFDFLQTSYKDLIISCAITLSSSIIYSFLIDDSGALLLGIFCTALLLIQQSVTAVRVKRGYFACNAKEAGELLQYIKDRTNKTQTPPGTRALPNEDEIFSEAIRELSILAGVGANTK